jgi:alpha-mannosidase
MSKSNIHIINHTHWDREWFVTSVVTSRWIPGLIDKLVQLAKKNPNFQYLFDGQTLVIEDLLTIAPDYAEKMGVLVRNGRLLIGPYYCQPDWQLTSGELLIRNLMYGRKDVEKHGGVMDTGWLVDTFGHISQSPQIHRLFDIKSVFVWRGVPQLEPYFHWQAPDGTDLLTINLFGGYRNLYGVTHAPEVAHKRLNSEVDKLRPFYPTPDMPLFDGYDLEGDPEDPMRFYTENGPIRSDLNLLESTPRTFAREIADKQLPLPTIQGELNSGKYGATFPGTFSARTYLKVMAHDCEQMLFQVCEPLAVMAAMKGRAYSAATYEGWGRQLLQNAVHDCICGVSVDQVHEKMEYSYRQAFSDMQIDMNASLVAILPDFAPGTYAVGTNAFAVDAWQRAGDELVHVQTDGVGVWPVQERLAVEQVNEVVSSFTWQNEHFTATVSKDGVVHVNEAVFGQLLVFAEHGDTYSNEKGEKLGVMQPTSPLTVVEKSERHCVVAFEAGWKTAVSYATAAVQLHFDQSPLIKWQIDLDSRGKNLSIDMVFETRQEGNIYAGMPFDVVKRPVDDTDLLPRDLDHSMKTLLLGQRELNAVTTFPFHDFVAVGNAVQSVAVLAKGIRSYDAQEDGTISATLRRSVEWLTEADLRDRMGDAGPFFYVPDARCERTVRHELALAFVADAPNSLTMQAVSAAYQNPPLVVAAKGSGSQTKWQFCGEDLPLASLNVRDGAVLARFYNPTGEERPFSQPYKQTDVWGTVQGSVEAVTPKKIQTVLVGELTDSVEMNDCQVSVLAGPTWRVGENQGLPETAVLDQLNDKITARASQVRETEAQLTACDDEKERLRLQHRWYVLKREQVEFQLSHLLNQRKMAENGALRYGYLYEPDAEIAEVSLELNNLRIKRRIYDYVVESLA